MQATQAFKVGDKVRSSYRNWTYGLVGVVVNTTAAVCLLLVQFEEANADGHDGHPSAGINDGAKTRYYLMRSHLTLVTKQPSAADRAAPSAAADLRLTPQAKIVLSHLKKRQRISPAEALTVYGISRLASCIHEIRNRAGYTVRTEQRRDDHGHKYAKYILAA